MEAGSQKALQEFVLDMGEHQKPVEGYEERCHVV